MKKIAIVILTFNTEDDTHVCLSSLAKIALPQNLFTTIIIDNGSKKVFALTKEEEKRDIVLLRQDSNLGFTGGNNIGMKYALDNTDAEFIMLLNNDTIVEKHMLTSLLAVCENDTKIGLAVPKIYFAKGHEYHKDRYAKDELGKVFWYAGGITDWANMYTSHRGVDEVDKGQYDTMEETPFATGCCMFIRRVVLETVGFFDNRYFLYSEDADLNERIKRAGYKIMYVPKAVLWHVNASSTGGSGSVLQDYFMTRNRMLIGMKFAPLRTKIALIRESVRFLRSGREWQKRGIRDFYTNTFGPGTFFNHK